ncbi:MAG: tetratricopeptide repeat protein, partial [Bacteroidales bacterium]|nr:tetratricopeptide repeat protein [Bacteroidales bacterium]
MVTFIKNRPIIFILSSFLFFNVLPAMPIDPKIDDLNHLLETSTGLKKIDVLNELSTVYDTISYIKSLEYANQALELARKYKSKKDIAMSLDRVGRVQYFLSNYDKSINYYMESLNILEEIGDKKAISKLYNNIGGIYLHLA